MQIILDQVLLQGFDRDRRIAPRPARFGVPTGKSVESRGERTTVFHHNSLSIRCLCLVDLRAQKDSERDSLVVLSSRRSNQVLKLSPSGLVRCDMREQLCGVPCVRSQVCRSTRREAGVQRIALILSICPYSVAPGDGEG